MLSLINETVTVGPEWVTFTATCQENDRALLGKSLALAQVYVFQAGITQGLLHRGQWDMQQLIRDPYALSFGLQRSALGLGDYKAILLVRNAANLLSVISEQPLPFSIAPSNPGPGPVKPPASTQLQAPVFTQAYRGRASANMNRRWEWASVPGATRYFVQPDWIAEVFVTTTYWEHVEQYETVFKSFSDALSPGPHTISVQAEVGGVLGPKATDTIVVRYSLDQAITTFQKQDIGLGGCIAHDVPTDLVGISYRFRIHTNRGIPPGNKIIFGGSRFQGPAGRAYALVQQFNTSRAVFQGPICNVRWGPSFTHPGESHVMITLGDYTGTGADRIGMRTFSPDTLPLVFGLIDGMVGVTNKSAQYQGNMNGVDGRYTLTKVGRIVDDGGWRCVAGALLPGGAYMQWDVVLEIAGVSSRVAIAVPEEYAHYLASDHVQSAQNFRWEFPLFPGLLTFYAWDVQIQREGNGWEPMRSWRVDEYKGLDSLLDFGVRVGEHNGQKVIELSNVAPTDYLPQGTVFSV